MKKILFNDKFLLTKAVLEGRKTQTRRVIPQSELEKINQFQEEYNELTFDRLEGVELITHFYLAEKLGRTPYKVGEVIAVAQSYVDCGNLPDYELDEDGYPIMPKRSGFFNKMFVRITDVRIQQLQDISDNDCIKEGVHEATKDFPWYWIDGSKERFNEPQQAFAHLINKVSKKDVWSENPYVFVYDFELVK